MKFKTLGVPPGGTGGIPACGKGQSCKIWPKETLLPRDLVQRSHHHLSATSRVMERLALGLKTTFLPRNWNEAANPFSNLWDAAELIWPGFEFILWQALLLEAPEKCLRDPHLRNAVAEMCWIFGMEKSTCSEEFSVPSYTEAEQQGDIFILEKNLAPVPLAWRRRELLLIHGILLILCNAVVCPNIYFKDS